MYIVCIVNNVSVNRCLAKILFMTLALKASLASEHSAEDNWRWRSSLFASASLPLISQLKVAQKGLRDKVKVSRSSFSKFLKILVRSVKAPEHWPDRSLRVLIASSSLCFSRFCWICFAWAEGHDINKYYNIFLTTQIRTCCQTLFGLSGPMSHLQNGLTNRRKTFT